MLRARLLSYLPVVSAVTVLAPSAGSGQALRKVREGLGTHSCRGFCSFGGRPPVPGSPAPTDSLVLSLLLLSLLTR
jgi:hypothetical protein